MLATPFVLVLASASSSAASRSSTVEVHSDTARTLEGERGSSFEFELRCDEQNRAARAVARPAARRRRREDMSFGLTLAEGERTGAHDVASLSALGCLQARPAGVSGIRPARPVRLRAESPAGRLLRVYPEEETAAGDRASARHPGVRRATGRQAEGRRDRVRRPAPVPARRPRTARELAGDGAPRRALGQRGAPGAKHRRGASCSTPSPRRGGRGGHAGPGGAGDRGARRRVPASTGPGRAPERSAARSTGWSRRWERCSSTASWRRCSTPRSCVSYAWQDIALIPTARSAAEGARARLTPLLDERMVGALRRRAGRGCDVAAIEISPESFVRGRAGEQPSSPTGSGSCAEPPCAAASARLGVPVVEWR